MPAAFAARAHLEDKSVELQVAKTVFYLSSFHFKEDNHSMELYTDPSAGSRRQEWVDFVRRRNDGYVLYLLWDQRIAIMLTILNSDTNTFQPRFFVVAMTNLYRRQCAKGACTSRYSCQNGYSFSRRCISRSYCNW